MINRFLGRSNTSSLLMARTSLDYFLREAPEEEDEDKRALFRWLLMRGKRSDVRLMHQISSGDLHSPAYTELRKALYSASRAEGLSKKQFCWLAELLSLILRLGKKTTHDPKLLPLLDTARCELEDAITAGVFTASFFQQMQTQLDRLSLALALSADGTGVGCTLELDRHFISLGEIVRHYFDPCIIADEDLMSCLSTVAHRLDHIQKPRYTALREQVLSLIRPFVAPGIQSHGEPGTSNLMSFPPTMIYTHDLICC